MATTQNAFSELANFNVNATLEEELDGLSLVLERNKVPSGGITVFELPSEGSKDDRQGLTGPSWRTFAGYAARDQDALG